MEPWRPDADHRALTCRAALLANLRRFFHEKGVLEVDTPVLSAAAVSDPNIHSLQTHVAGTTAPRYLHTSPEFPMKRLLAAGSGDIYQICKVFRQAELGRNHNPEFTLLEWYRLGFNHHQLMDEVAELLALAMPEIAAGSELRIRYHEAFHRYAEIDVEADLPTMRKQIARRGERPPDGLRSKTEWLDWVMGVYVAPALPQDRFTFVYDYPADQAALARLRHGPPTVAERFEVFFGELELANGFHELADADQQLRRFVVENRTRAARGWELVAIDQHLIEALRHGLPDCSGVALGIDRLLMLCLQKSAISAVLSFGFARA